MAEFTSKATIARPNSTSLRTTIPEGIVKLLDLKIGDSLKWNVNAKASKLTLSVTKG